MFTKIKHTRFREVKSVDIPEIFSDIAGTVSVIKKSSSKTMYHVIVES